MHYNVVWEGPCFEAIDDLMAQGMPGETIRNAVRAIHSELENDAENKGRSLSERLRRLDIAPFRAYFHVDKARLRVFVSLLHWEPESFNP
jgi:hypothetical protein